jgi:adenine-specific DNA-methyltransferase
LKCIKKLLHETGTSILQLNDEEMAYCKVLVDEVFGRNNFISDIRENKNLAWHSGGGEG